MLRSLEKSDVTRSMTQKFQVFRPLVRANEAPEPATDDFNTQPLAAMKQQLEDIMRRRGWDTRDRIVAEGTQGDVVVFCDGKIDLVGSD